MAKEKIELEGGALTMELLQRNIATLKEEIEALKSKLHKPKKEE